MLVLMVHVVVDSKQSNRDIEEEAMASMGYHKITHHNYSHSHDKYMNYGPYFEKALDVYVYMGKYDKSVRKQALVSVNKW